MSKKVTSIDGMQVLGLYELEDAIREKVDKAWPALGISITNPSGKRIIIQPDFTLGLRGGNISD